MTAIMRIPTSIFILLATIILLTAGCSGNADSNVANGNRSIVTNSPAANVSSVNSPVETTKKPIGETANNAPTLAPVVNAYYDALRKKDDAALRDILSAAYFAKVSADMKKEKKSGMAAYLAEYDTVPEKPMEVRNEKITGDKAMAEIKGGAYVNWTSIGFSNEGGKWKLNGESADINNVTSAPGANTSK